MTDPSSRDLLDLSVKSAKPLPRAPAGGIAAPASPGPGARGETMAHEGASPNAARDRELFDAIADRYARKDLLPASRAARRERLLRTLAAIPELPERPAVLEIGCGAGYAADYLAGRYRSYLGIDHSRRLIEHARRRHANGVARFEVADAASLDDGQRYDLVLMIGVLHHLEDPLAALRTARRLLRPGGYVAANEPQPANPVVQLARALRKRIDSTYSEDQCTLSCRQLRSLYEAAALEQIRIVPQGLLSTPFAEVPAPAQWLSAPVSRLACRADRVLERPAALARRLSWNLVAVGRRPPGDR